MHVEKLGADTGYACVAGKNLKGSIEPTWIDLSIIIEEADQVSCRHLARRIVCLCKSHCPFKHQRLHLGMLRQYLRRPVRRPVVDDDRLEHRAGREARLSQGLETWSEEARTVTGRDDDADFHSSITVRRNPPKARSNSARVNRAARCTACGRIESWMSCRATSISVNVFSSSMSR